MVKILRLAVLFVVILIMAGCSITDLAITEEQAVASFEKQGVELKKVERDPNNAFMKSYGGIEPVVYETDKNQLLSIYIYGSKGGAGKGIKNFKFSTATAELDKHRILTAHNMMILYFSAEDNDSRIEDAVEDMLFQR